MTKLPTVKRGRPVKVVKVTDSEKMNLKQKLEYSEELFNQTGHYYGIKQFSLRDEDPLRFERVYGKLRGALVGARESALHISASVIVRNIGELCFSLYTPEGDTITISTGIIVHVHTISEFIKYMIRNDYEQDPGIKDRDIFCNNDSAIGGVHTSDIATAVPIFHQGKLIGWSSGVTHEPDCGGPTPAHTPSIPQSRFEDGYIIMAEKIGEADKVYKTYRNRSLKATRTPMYWDLDEKARLAGCHKIREAVLRIIQEEGLDYYLQFMREIIEEGRQIALARARERLVPGRYRAVTSGPYVLIEVALGTVERQREDMDRISPIEIIVKPDGEIQLSAEGSGPSKSYPYNCSVTAMQGGLWVLLSQMLFYDGRVNDGSYLAVKSYFPPGSECNPTDPHASYSAAWGTLMTYFTGLVRCLSRGFYSRGYREEVIGSYGETCTTTQGGGTLTDGTYFQIATFDVSAVGMGACAVRDGLDYGYAMWNPESDMGDIETWESVDLGFPWLGRRVKPDTAGFGKYRGATEWESLRMAHGVRSMWVMMVRSGGVAFVFPGMMGGYPNTTDSRSYMKKTNLQSIFTQKKPYPTGEANPNDSEITKYVEGDYFISERCNMLGTSMKDFDLMHGSMSGSPGFGDPILRDVDLVKNDLNEGVYSAPLVERVYGVIAKYNEKDKSWEINLPATEKARQAIRDQRKARSVSFGAFYEAERKIVLEKSVIEPLRNMYRDVMQLSPIWAKEFREYYMLPGDFQF